MHTRSFCPRRVIFEIEMRAAYLFTAAFLLSWARAFAQDGFFADWFNMVSETQTAPPSGSLHPIR
jgi:hypothetical protein